MELIDMHQIMELLNPESGRGIIQCVLLFMIWLNSIGLKSRLDKIETRITILESPRRVI